MPRQAGPNYFTGILNEYIYYETKNGWFFRKYTKPSAETLAGPAFDGHRARSQSFKTATTAGKIIRQSFVTYTGGIGDSRLNTRLVSVLKLQLELQRMTSKQPAVMTQEALIALNQFQWDERHKMPPALMAATNLKFPKEDGSFELIINSLSSLFIKGRGTTATHFKVFAVLMAIDFRTERTFCVQDTTSFIDYGVQETGDFMLSGRLETVPDDSLFLLGLGLKQFELIGDKPYEFIDGSAFCILGI